MSVIGLLFDSVITKHSTHMVALPVEAVTICDLDTHCIGVLLVVRHTALDPFPRLSTEWHFILC